MIKRITRWLLREPSIWRNIDQMEVHRKFDDKIVEFVFIQQDQYGNIRQRRIKA